MAGTPEHRHLLDRSRRENCVLRQFFERRGTLIRLYLDVPFLVTSPEPLAPFATPEEVGRRKIWLAHKNLARARVRYFHAGKRDQRDGDL